MPGPARRLARAETIRSRSPTRPPRQPVLATSGLVDIGVIDVREPFYFGPDTAAAHGFVTSMRHSMELLTYADAVTAERARWRLRVALAEYDTGNDVYVGPRAWIITARRG